MKFVYDNQMPYDAEHCKPITPPNEQLNKAIEAFNNMNTILETIVPTIRKLVETVAPILNPIIDKIKTYPNKRVVYLATHGKKRVRKRNINRIMKWIQEGVRR
jgi:hypothetical protein